MSNNLKIAIAESSVIVRSGIEVELKNFPDFHFQLIEIADSEQLSESVRFHRPDLLIINPLMMTDHAIQHLKDESGNQSMKCIALLYGMVDKTLLRSFDEHITLYDAPSLIRKKIEQFYADGADGEDQDNEEQQLSPREKEIVVCVVKGMTNREIANSLYLSTHTVITHRRNIARKLQIHSSSGLTVYAIVNKLVELSEIGKL